MDCVAVSDQTGVMCRETASNQDISIAETDLFGYDQSDRHYDWFAVTSSGEVHDRIGEFLDADTFHAHLSWTQGKMVMKGSINSSLAGQGHMTFDSTASADGNPIAVFRGSLTK